MSTEHADPWPDAFATALASCGHSERALSDRLEYSLWYAHELTTAVQAEPAEQWYARLDRDAQAGHKAVRDHALACIDVALEHGPRSLARMPVRDILALGDQRLRDFAETYRPAEVGGCLVTGPTGVGKSVVATAILLRELIPVVWSRARKRLVRFPERGPDGERYVFSVADGPEDFGHRFVRAADLERAVRQHPLGKGEAPLVMAAMEAELLVVDDIGHEQSTETTWTVLAARYDAGRVTIATSGWPAEKLVERFGPAALRRITEAGARKGGLVEVWDS